eukprot:scaffold174109_cov30-Tisochrysis_lutea.AAC.1
MDCPTRKCKPTVLQPSITYSTTPVQFVETLEWTSVFQLSEMRCEREGPRVCSTEASGALQLATSARDHGARDEVTVSSRRPLPRRSFQPVGDGNSHVVLSHV